MKLFLVFIALIATSLTGRAQELLDRLGDDLSISTDHDNIRARISGTLDLEYYHFEQPAPGLIDARGHDLFNPRLTLFLDSQLGSQFYFFAQTRIDRHFDPSDRGAQIRLDEYALRFTPWNDGRLNLQVGKFATVFARWVERHLSWDNPFVTAPLVYENTLPLEDYSAPYLPYRGKRRDEKREYIPVIWGPSYASGASVSGKVGSFDYAAELKNAALSSRPESWDATRVGFDHPTISGRLGYRPDESWEMGISASDGTYLNDDADTTLPANSSIGDYREKAFAEDIAYAHHHFRFYAEFHETEFEVPRVGNGDTFGYFLEASYKFTPQLLGAVRWNQQFFNDVTDGFGDEVKFAPDISRVEIAGTYRFTEHMQLRLEYYLEMEEHRSAANDFAAQFTIRF